MQSAEEREVGRASWKSRKGLGRGPPQAAGTAIKASRGESSLSSGNARLAAGWETAWKGRVGLVMAQMGSRAVRALAPHILTLSFTENLPRGYHLFPFYS